MTRRSEIPDFVKKAFGDSNEKKITETLFYLMKELHIPYSEIIEMPIPAIMQLVEHLAEHNKREAAAAKRRK